MVKIVPESFVRAPFLRFPSKYLLKAISVFWGTRKMLAAPYPGALAGLLVCDVQRRKSKCLFGWGSHAQQRAAKMCSRGSYTFRRSPILFWGVQALG
jgi:hypothetical protein